MSLGAVVFSGWAFVTSLREQVPTDMETFVGSGRDVKYQHRRTRVGAIGFRVGPASPTFWYDSYFPSFEATKRCLVPGAALQLRTSRGPDRVIWELRCGPALSIDSAQMLAARRANGRAAGWVMGFFCVATLFCLWLIGSS